MANEVNRIAELLLDAWKKADPKSSVALHPTSYVATFADMAKAIIEDRTTRPSAPVEGLEEIVKKAMHETWNDICDDTGCHPLDIHRVKRGGLMFIPDHWANAVAESVRSRAEAIIAAERAEKEIAERNRDAARENFLTMQKTAAKLLERAEKAEADNAALTARVKELKQRCADWSKSYAEKCSDYEAQKRHAEALEIQLAAAKKVRKAAEKVVWFDWSDNDDDAVKAISDLRAALEAKP